MKRVATSRRVLVDLLRRRPVLDPVEVDRTAWEAARRVDELRALLRLVEVGLLSAEELDLRQAQISRSATVR
jgi:hypothetical protein